ncbi:potassium transporter [Filibacter tadaridae]|uniref:Pilus assembly protein, PilO n=1 Tax=Filibacter tadaridae TaxID=2483811 RepID=A0A3P5XD66_9BACL|nr:potassium transporter [Filibacter tadaridae]VDC32621.1 hypothetical protein FILTAD_02823 [Filibacter tadaridae]
MTMNRMLPFALVTVLLISLLFAFYFYLVKPVQDEVMSIETSVASSKQEVATLEARIEANSWGKDDTSEMKLLEKVPDNRELSNVIEILQEAELGTESTIQSIAFNNYDGSVQESTINVPEPETNPESESETSETPEENSSIESEGAESEVTPSPTPVSEIAETSLPESLKLLTLETTVTHKDYEQFLLFLKEIEKNERIIKIDSVNFSLPGEDIGADEVETISSTIRMTTFYLQ